MLHELSIEIIRKCPNNCLHCSSESSINCKEIINYETFVRVIDDAIELGLKTVCFSGGEPFLHADLLKMTEYVNKKGLNSYVYTSGIYFENGQRTSLPISILKEISNKVTKLIFNIEAANENTYDVIMGTKGCFDLLKESITNANRFNIITEAHFVPMKLNVNEITSMINLCNELGITKVSFLRLVLHGRATYNSEKLSLTDNETKKLRKQLDEIKKTSKLYIRIGIPLSEDAEGPHCEAAKGKINIKYDGAVYPCEVFKNKRISVGNNLEPDNIYEKDLKSIYDKSEYLRTVRSFVNEYNCSKTCENCIGQYFINK